MNEKTKTVHGAVTEEVRRAIQNSDESLKTLARRYGINIKTVQKWRNRNSVEDASRSPKTISASQLNDVEQSVIISFRRHSLLPLDDCLYALQTTIPHLTRSSLHRCLQRYKLSRLDNIESGLADAPANIGCFGIYKAEVWSSGEKNELFMAVDRKSKLILGHMFHRLDKANAASFLDWLLQIVPYKIHTVLTDNRSPFVVDATSRGEVQPGSFEEKCAVYGIEHNLADYSLQVPGGRSSQAQAIARISRSRHFEYRSFAEAELRLNSFLYHYNMTRRLKTLRGLTPHEFICGLWRAAPENFLRDPYHDVLGPVIGSMASSPALTST